MNDDERVWVCVMVYAGIRWCMSVWLCMTVYAGIRWCVMMYDCVLCYMMIHDGGVRGYMMV